MEGTQSLAYKKAYAFSIAIVDCFRFLSDNRKEYVLSKQLLRSGTSVGANLAEANGAISKADFSNKVSISYKECLESKYWINLLYDTQYIEKELHDRLFNQADEICRILFTILKTTRINPKKD